jgi:hypothetical protein
MQARIVSAKSGAFWLVQGWRIFRRSTLGWLAFVASYLLLTNLAAYVPVVGIFVALVLVQPLSAGLMAGARAASHGAMPELSLLFEGFRTERRAQLTLGVIYMVASVLVFWLTALADGSGQLRAMLSGSLKPEELVPAQVLQPLIVAGLLYTPVMMAFWFAPPLAAWHGTGAAKALFFSFYASLVNWRAFLGYGALALLLLVVLPLVGLSLLVLITGGQVKLSMVGLLAALLLVMLPTLLASFYASYRDVFAADENPRDPV